MSTGNVPPNSNTPPVNPSAPSSGSGTPPSESGFAKMFPAASPQQLQQIINTFLRTVISQMNQDNQNMLQALQQLGQSEQGNDD